MNKNLKKAISSVAALAMSASCFTAFAATFSDVPETLQYIGAIDELVALNIVNGYDDGLFKPDQQITRAEVTKMVVAAMGPAFTKTAESAAATAKFTDCTNHWANGYINVGVDQQFINGMGDGTFSPDTDVTYAQIVKMLVAALGYSTNAEGLGGYPNGYIQVGTSVGICEGVKDVTAETPVTRAQVAQLIDNAIATPIVAVTNWTTDLNGNAVAQREVMDGTGDSEKYQTLLTEYHNAYKVKGRVTATHAQGTTDKDKVQFSVEYADNFDKEKIAAGKDKKDYNKGATVEQMFFGDTIAPDLLFTYSDTLVQKDDNDEYHILSIHPYGTNQVEILKSDDYEGISDSNIEFSIGTTSKTKTYKLDKYCSVYVNGIEAADKNSSTAKKAQILDEYAAGNKIGTIELLDTPAEGSTSKDGKYDYIMVSYQKYGVVDSTEQTSNRNKIYLDEYQAGNGMNANITMDTDDDDLVFTYEKDGIEVSFEDVKEDDVLLITYDVISSNTINDSNFIKYDICDTVVEGEVTKIDSDTDKTGLYTVDGVQYSYVGDAGDGKYSLEVGTYYTLYLDSTGRIVKYEESTSAAKNYGVIDRVYNDSSSGDNKIRIIKGDGTKTSYTVKNDKDYTKALNQAYTDGKPDGKLADVNERIISYKLNSKNEISSWSEVKTEYVHDTEYKASSTKVGGAKMNDATTVIDLSDAADPIKSVIKTEDLKSGSLNTFVDGDNYTLYYGSGADKSSNGYTRVVVITEGSAAINVKTHFATFDAWSEGQVDGSSRVSLEVFDADSTEKKSIYISEDESDSKVKAFQRGDVIVYSTKMESGTEVADDITLLFATDSLMTDLNSGIAFDEAYDFYEKNIKDNSKKVFTEPAGYINWYMNSGINSWDTSKPGDRNGSARVGFGLILDKGDSNITIANVTKDIPVGATNIPEDAKYVSIETKDTKDFDLDTSDLNVYVYDCNESVKTTSSRVAKGSKGSIVKTNVTNKQKVEISGRDVYFWNTKTLPTAYANYAFYKTIDNDITDILVIVANSDANN